MCRRRFFKSYFYIDYNGVKYQNGETVPVSPFPAAGGSVTITLVAARPWQITNSSWLSISSIQDKSGTYTITLTASANESYSSRSGSFTANTLDERNRIVVSFSQEPQASQKYLTVSPNPLNLGAEDSGTLVCYLHYNGTVSIVTPTWSESSPVIQIDANGGVTSNNTDPSPVNNIPVTATYVHEGDTLTTTSTVNVGAASIEYRNLYVDPSNMTLGKGDEEGIQAFVEEYVNGHHTRDVEVTLSSTWTSADDSIADVSRSGNNEVVTPVYGQGYYPDMRNTTVTATYQGMTASCDVTVKPEGYIEYEIIVSPTTRTLEYGETYNGVVVTYYVITDGVRDAGTDVTTTSTYSPDNSATTVSVGANAVTLTGNNTGTTDQDTVITVSYPNCESKTITVTNRASVYNPSIVWQDDEIEFPAYWTESVSIIERFDFVDINPSTIGVEVIDGESLEASNLYVGAHYGSSDIVPSSFNYETERQLLGTVRVSGLGLDGIVYYDDLDVYQEAGVETYLLIEHEEEHTDARSDTAGTSLIYTIQFDGIDESSLAISGYEGNISDAYIMVDGESMSVTLDANTALTQVTSDLYIIARTVYGDEISAHLIITQPAYVPTCSLVWEDETLRFPAFGTNATTEEFYYNNIRYATIGVEIIAGSDKFSVSNILIPESNTETGSCEVETLVQNRTLQPVTLGTIRVSGTGLDNAQHIDILTIVQDAGVTPYLLIENETEHTEARSVPAGANLEFDLDFGHLDVSTINYTFVGATQKNISSVSVDTANGKLYVTLAANEDPAQATSDVYVTATTVYGDTISAHLIITQPAYVPTCSLVWNVNTFCGDTKYITVAAYRPGNYEQDDLIEAIGYIPQNVSNISLSILSDTDGMIDNGTLAGNNSAQYVIYVNPLNTERYAIVRIEGDGDDGNTYHDDLIIFQRYVEPDLLVNGSAIYEVTVTSAFTGNDYTLAWHYADPDSVGIVSYNGFITSCTMGQKTTGGDDGECDITVEVAPNTGSSVFENVVIFTGTSVLGLTMTAELHIYQEPQDIPLITLTWNYSVHFIGRPPQNNFSIRFDLYNGNDEKIWDVDLTESSYDDSEVNQTFSDTATITVPASTSFAGLYAENSPEYTGQYWETVRKVGNVITTELVVPSVEPIELYIHVQAFSDAATGSFPFEITLQSLSYDDQTPVGDAWVTPATTEAGSTTIDVLANTGNTVPATLAFQDFRTRMGYWLGIHVDNQDTGTYSNIAVVIEDGTHKLDELPVIGHSGNYMVFVGGENYDWDGGDLFIKFIDETMPSPSITLDHPQSINWGQTGDETEIEFTVSNAVKVVAEWNPSTSVGLGVPNMIVEDGATVSGGSITLYPNGVLIPQNGATAFTGTTITLTADTNYPYEHASPGLFEGDIVFTAYSSNGNTSSIRINCAA